jgi:hypothetical protein
MLEKKKNLAGLADSGKIDVPPKFAASAGGSAKEHKTRKQRKGENQ